MTKVLVVDDNAFQRKKIIKIIKDSFDFDIIEAEDGEDALVKVDQETPDFIMSDLVMPNLDGIGFLTELRKRGNETPVVILTSDVEEEQRNKCRDLGAKAFLGKPPKPDKLTVVINKILELIS